MTSLNKFFYNGFLDLLNLFNLSHVSIPAHNKDNILDFVTINMNFQNLTIDYDGFIGISDHCHVSLTQNLNGMENKSLKSASCSRNFSRINLDEFSSDLFASLPPLRYITNTNSLRGTINSALSIPINKHTSLKTQIVAIRKNASMFTSKCRQLYREKRKLKWQMNKAKENAIYRICQIYQS